MRHRILDVLYCMSYTVCLILDVLYCMSYTVCLIPGSDKSTSGHFSVRKICTGGQFSIRSFAGPDISPFMSLHTPTHLCSYFIILGYHYFLTKADNNSLIISKCFIIDCKFQKRGKKKIHFIIDFKVYKRQKRHTFCVCFLFHIGTFHILK